VLSCLLLGRVAGVEGANVHSHLRTAACAETFRLFDGVGQKMAECFRQKQIQQTGHRAYHTEHQRRQRLPDRCLQRAFLDVNVIISASQPLKRKHS